MTSTTGKFTKFIVATGAAAILATGSLAAVPRPASADTTSTVLTAAAVIGGLVLLNDANQHRDYGYDNNGGYYGNGNRHRFDHRDGGRRH